MILARVETRNFQFTALGESEPACDALLLLGWEEHAEEYGGGVDPEMMREMIAGGDVNYYPMEPGHVLRDHDLIYQGGAAIARDSECPNGPSHRPRLTVCRDCGQRVAS